jgi:acylphosphatase
MLEKGFRISGRVQGVGFRWWTRSQALRLNLTGSVRNCADGSVEVLLRGSSERVAAMERLLHQGPPDAEVSAVEQLTDVAPPVDGFHVTR